MGDLQQQATVSWSEWIDEKSNCPICGAKVAELNEDTTVASTISRQISADIDTENCGGEPSSKRNRTHNQMVDDTETVRVIQSQTMGDDEIARVVYARQLKLSWPTLSRCVNCFKVDSNRPSQTQLTGTLLDDELARIQEGIDSAVANAGSITLMIDGWSRTGHANSLLHICLHTGIHDGQPIFLHSTPVDNVVRDAADITRIICEIMENSDVHADIQSKLVAIVTNNTGASEVLSQAWNLEEENYPKIFCYGSSSGAIKQLAKDFCKIDSISKLLAKNQLIAEFFAQEGVREVLLQRCKDNNCSGQCETFPAEENLRDIGLPNFFMMGRNLALQDQLSSMISDCVFLDQFERYEEVRKLITDTEEAVWELTWAVVSIFHVLAYALGLCQSYIFPLSAMPHIWAYIALHLNNEALSAWGFDEVTIESIYAAVVSRRAMNVRPVACAAYALDPYFRGKLLSNEEWETALDVILSMSSSDIDLVTTDFTEYRTRDCLISELEKFVADAQTDSYLQNQIDWWNGFAPNSSLVPIAKTLLAIPASVADVKRYRRFHNAQVDDSQLEDDVQCKLEKVSYNLNIKYCHDEDKKNYAKRMKKVLSLCTSHGQSGNIREESKDPVQPNQKDPTERSNTLLEPPPSLLVQRENNSAGCSEDRSMMPWIKARLREGSPYMRFEYDGDVMSLWSSRSSLLSFGEGNDSPGKENEIPLNSNEEAGDLINPPSNPLVTDDERTESADSQMLTNYSSTSDQESADQRTSLMEHRFVADKENMGPLNSMNLRD